MPKRTEDELIYQTRVDLNYCALLEKKGGISLQEIGELIPGYIHLNSNNTGGLEFLSQKALEIFERDMEEIFKLGPRFLMEITDRKSQATFLKKRDFFIKPKNSNKTFSHLQRLHYPRKKIPYTLFYTTSKIYEGDSIVSFTQPLDTLEAGSFIYDIIDSSYDFYNKHFYKFEKLTPREQEILELVVDGMDSRMIADALCVSFHTVRTHRKNICHKLETSKLSDLEKFIQVFTN